MDEFLCVTVVSNPGESRADFTARLSHFWTHMLRTRPDDFEKVYAEATQFESSGDAITRQYLVEPQVIPVLEQEMRAGRVTFEPIDADDSYSKYEATPADWMQIEH